MSGDAWVDLHRDDVGDVLTRYVDALYTRYHEPRINRFEIYAAIYSESIQANLTPSRTRQLTSTPTRAAALTWNVTRSVADTGISKIIQSRPRPSYLTDGGNFEQQGQAEELQKLTDGVFAEQRVYQTAVQWVTDAIVFGTGFMKTMEVAGRPVIERIVPSEILVDDLMCQFSAPREMFQRKEIPRASLAALFPKFKATILKDAPAVEMKGEGFVSDMVETTEAWHLPDSVDSPGRHVLVVKGVAKALVDEEWNSPRFPFAVLRWRRPLTGYYGIGVAEGLLGIQFELNKFLIQVSRALTNFGVAKMLIPNGARIDPNMITNTVDGQIIPYDGMQAPTMFANQILSPEVTQYLMMQYSKAFEIEGISPGAAFAVREQGIPSAKGQREISERQGDRLSVVSQDYEQGFLDTAQNVIDVCRKIRKRGGELVVQTADDGNLHRVEVDEALALQPSDYTLGMFAGNLLSKTPAGKFEDAQTLLNSKAITVDEFRGLMDMPDIKSVLKRTVDAEKLYRKQIQNALRKGVPPPQPEQYWPSLDKGLRLYQEAIFEAQSNQLPEDRVGLLRAWVDSVAELVEQAAPPPPPAEAMPPV